MRLDGLWYGTGRPSAVGRTVASPLGALYCGAMAVRNVGYDRGWLPVYAATLPVVSVGNLSVGGTGKTPLTAYLASRLGQRGARPAIVLRGYGGDETDVHQILNPAAIVVADVDRVRGSRTAAGRGASVVLLDDGFQHRRLARTEDVVLVDAERARLTRCIPAGPLRESVHGLRRATLVVVTIKSSDDASAEQLASTLAPYTSADRAIVRFAPHSLRRVGAVDAGVELPLAELGGKSALVLSAIANPAAFETQVSRLVARHTAARFSDHHRFSPADAQRLASAGEASDFVICTLKDAVKLGRLWPHNAPPLWYVSQRVEVPRGGEAIDRLLDRVLSATTST